MEPFLKAFHSFTYMYTTSILLLSSFLIPASAVSSDTVAGMATEYDTYANLHPAVEIYTQGFHYHIH